MSSSTTDEEFKATSDSDDSIPIENPAKKYYNSTEGLKPPTETPKFEGQKGCLAFVFTGVQDDVELQVFRKVCMKFGMQAWDDMIQYLPWRNRATLRTTLCKIIRKQALSEYDGIKADPFQIKNDNQQINEGESDASGYTMKGGMLVNQKWDRNQDEWEEVRKGNTAKYGISEADAAKIDVPCIISVDYMKQQIENRRQSLLLHRAAVIDEISRRKGIPNSDLKVKDLVIMPSECLDLPTHEINLPIGNASPEHFFQVDDNMYE